MLLKIRGLTYGPMYPLSNQEWGNSSEVISRPVRALTFRFIHQQKLRTEIEQFGLLALHPPQERQKTRPFRSETGPRWKPPCCITELRNTCHFRSTVSCTIWMCTSKDSELRTECKSAQSRHVHVIRE